MYLNLHFLFSFVIKIYQLGRYTFISHCSTDIEIFAYDKSTKSNYKFERIFCIESRRISNGMKLKYFENLILIIFY